MRHRLHKGTFDHLQRALKVIEGLKRVLIDELRDSVQESVADPLRDRVAPPLLCNDNSLLTRVTILFCKRCKDICGAIGTVPQQVINGIHEVRRNGIVRGESACIYDSHVQSGLNGLKQECTVDGFAYRVVPPEREGDVRYSTRYTRTW